MLPTMTPVRKIRGEWETGEIRESLGLVSLDKVPEVWMSNLKEMHPKKLSLNRALLKREAERNILI